MEDLFFQLHQGLPREGPGSDDYTRKVYDLLALDSCPRILDVGCGPGAQTLVLAQASNGIVVALDNHAPFLAQLHRKVAEAGLQDVIETVEGSMFALPRATPYDLIWAEGSIYIMGVKQALTAWKDMVKPSGWVVFSDATWLQPDPPQEVWDFWQEEYPQMQTVEGNLARIRECGYRVQGHLVLPAHCWWDSYYQPLQTRIQQLQEEYAADTDALQFLAAQQEEIRIFQEYHGHYGYVFYLAQRMD